MTHVGDSFQQPANTFSAKNVIHDFYRSIPSDQRYRGNSELVIAPTAPLSQMAGDNSKIDFFIPGKSVNGVLRVQDMQLVIDLKLTNIDGSQITAGGAYASVTNNVLNSLFEAIEIKINEQSINKQTASGHPYKSYIGRLLSYDDDVKDTLQVSGYLPDITNEFDNVSKNGNMGLTERAKWWCEVAGQSFTYTNTAHRFIGNVDHDLSGLSVGLPPGTSVGFTFKQTKDDFRILGALPTTNPQNQYALTITHIAMHIPIRYLAENLLADLSLKMQKEDVKLPFRALTLGEYTIPLGLREFIIPDLFPGQSIPTKIIVTLVSMDAFTGNPVLNPFR